MAPLLSSLAPYEGININKTVDIPCDYDGIMGVPITFLDKYSPDQFEILGITCRGYSPEYHTKFLTRLIIRMQMTLMVLAAFWLMVNRK